MAEKPISGIEVKPTGQEEPKIADLKDLSDELESCETVNSVTGGLERYESMNSATGETYSTLAVASTELPEKLEADPSHPNLHEDSGATHPVDQLFSPEGSPRSHITIPESQATPSSQVSVKGDTSGSSNKENSFHVKEMSMPDKHQLFVALQLLPEKKRPHMRRIMKRDGNDEVNFDCLMALDTETISVLDQFVKSLNKSLSKPKQRQSKSTRFVVPLWKIMEQKEQKEETTLIKWNSRSEAITEAIDEFGRIKGVPIDTFRKVLDIMVNREKAIDVEACGENFQRQKPKPWDNKLPPGVSDVASTLKEYIRHYDSVNEFATRDSATRTSLRRLHMDDRFGRLFGLHKKMSACCGEDLTVALRDEAIIDVAKIFRAIHHIRCRTDYNINVVLPRNMNNEEILCMACYYNISLRLAGKKNEASSSSGSK